MARGISASLRDRQPFLEIQRSVRFLRIRWYSLVLSFSLAGALSSADGMIDIRKFKRDNVF